MFLSSSGGGGIRRGLFAFCGNRLYRREPKAEFVTLGKIFERESCRRNVRQKYFRVTSAEIRMAHTMTQTTWVTTKDETREMMALWPDVVRDLTETDRYLDIPDVTKWIAKVLQYNVPTGRKGQAISLVNAYRMLMPPEQLTKENIYLARIMGWCIEILQTFLLIIDDIQDRSKMRRNRVCWYLHDNIGLVAINDALFLEGISYELLRSHLKGKDCYLEIMELLRESTMKTVMGQCLDLLSTNFGKKINLDLFTMNRYNSIAKYKTGHYAFLLPVRIAMYLAGLKDPEMHRQVKPILLELGHYYQVQNDFLDCYGDPEVIGKNGTDIQEGKCTWLIVVALQRATPEQRKILDDCYGSKDPEKVELIKRLYDDMALSNSYSIYEEETFDLLTTRIKKISCGVPNDIFLNLLKKIRSRL